VTVRPILVTGVAGFIGSHVARRLVADGAKVVGVDDLSMGHRTNIPSEIDFVEGDLSEASTYDKLPSQIDHILHLAGQSSGEISFDDPVADLEKNTVSTLRMVDYATRASASKLVYASSMSVYGDVPDSAIVEDQVPRPLSCYGVGKLAAEQYLKIFAKKMPSLSFRMFNVYGPGQDMTNLRQGMISIYVAQALRCVAACVTGDAAGCSGTQPWDWRAHDGSRCARHDRRSTPRCHGRADGPDAW